MAAVQMNCTEFCDQRVGKQVTFTEREFSMMVAVTAIIMFTYG